MTQRTFSIYPPDNAAPLVLRCDEIDISRVDDILQTSEINVIGQLSNSSNGALLGSISVDEQTQISVVIKPSMYENPLVDFEWGTLSKREVCAYEVSKALGFNVVPPTVLRDVDNLEASVQLFIPHDPRQHYFTIAPKRHRDMEKFIVFDYITNNADRKAGHILAEEEKSFELHLEQQDHKNEVITNVNARLWGIDHGLTFNVEDKLRTVMWEYAEEQISETLVSDMAKALYSLQGILDKYLSGFEVEKTIERVEKLLMNPFHRALDSSERSFPWPLV